jgi:dihydroxyacetone kinase-like protein
MAQEITTNQLRKWLLAYAARIIENEDHLTKLDTAIGDADHGVNMRRGMGKLQERLRDEGHSEDVSAFLRSVAMTLISGVGGAAGPLYGTFFLRAATSPTNGSSVDLEQLTQMFRYGLDGLQQRGKAQADDKTMIDTIQPAVEAMEAALAAHQSAAVVLAAARQAALLGMKRTIEIEARKGRASYLGPHSIGHQDPGATSAYFLFETAAEVFTSTGAD